MESTSLGYTQKLISTAFDKWLKKRGLAQSSSNNFLFNRFERIAKNKANAKPKVEKPRRELAPKLTQEQIREKWKLAARNRRAKQAEERSKLPEYQQSEERKRQLKEAKERYIAKHGHPKMKYRSDEHRQQHLQKMREWRAARVSKMTEEEKEANRQRRAEKRKQKAIADWEKRKAAETPEKRWERLEYARNYRLKQKEQNETAKV